MDIQMDSRGALPGMPQASAGGELGFGGVRGESQGTRLADAEQAHPAITEGPKSLFTCPGTVLVLVR